MKLSLLTLAALVAIVAAYEPDQTIKKADAEFLKKQAKVLSLYVGLGSDLESKHHHEHVPFPYNDAKYYKKPQAWEGFMKSYERGLIDRHGVFTMYCHKNRHDTFKAFDIMYFAKDFDTLYDIASWARKELNPLQFFYSFTMAILHREDTRGFYVPPVFEVFPHYFIQSSYMNKAIAYNTFHSNEAAKTVFNVNTTSWDYSWHGEMTGGIYPTGPRWSGDDYNSRLDYIREDVAWGNAFEYWNMRFATWLSTEQYPEIHFSHRGENLYSFYKSILDRYNLERIAVSLPAMPAFDTSEPMPGYNSHVTDYLGRSFLVRTDGIVPEIANPDASWEADITEKRVQKSLDAGFFWVKDQMINTTDREGFDTFAKMVFATRDSYNRKYYKALYYKLMEAAKEVVKAPNDRDYTTTALGLTMTQPRDPVFYMVLASIEEWFYTYLYDLPAYTEETLKFSGVTLESFDVSKLMTFSTRQTFELTNGLPFNQVEDRFKYRSYASLYHLDHKSFEYEFKIKSDKAQDAMIRVMMGPKRDADGRILSLNQMRRAFVPLNKYIVKLNAGENVFKKHSFQPEFYDKTENFYDMYARVNKSIETNEPFEYSELTHCGAPYSLQLPKGTPYGREYVMFVMVTPYFADKIDKEGFYQCNHNLYMDQYSIGYPFDREIAFPNTFQQDNMIFKDVKIFHEYIKASE